MNPRAEALIAELGLVPHPEGGYYRELYRSASLVQPLDARSARPALTTIHFLLPGGEVSRWHRVASDEVWHVHDGDPLELVTAPAGFAEIERHILGPVRDGMTPEHVVAAGLWQAARSTGAWTLAGCTVAPGFDFADFTLLRHAAQDTADLRSRHPGLTLFL